jgi:tRNA A-37 threonylcarbamoyl transferase component Bud32
MTSQNRDIQPDHPTVSFEKGETYMAMGLLREAIREYHRALSEESLRYRSSRRIAECMVELKQFDQAEKVLLQALLSLNVPKEDRLHIYFDLAVLYLSRGRFESALERLMQIRNEDDKIVPDIAQRIEAAQKMIGSPASALADMMAFGNQGESQSYNDREPPASPVVQSTTDYSDPRRRARRVKLVTSVQYSFNQDNWSTGYSTDLSTDGMFMLTHEPVPVGSVVFLKFNLPDISVDSMIEIVGLAVRQDIRQVEIDKILGMGIKFASIDEPQRNKLKSLVEKLVGEEQKELLRKSRLSFHCDGCGRILTAPESLSGKLGKCLCGHTNAVPFSHHTPTPDNPVRGLVLAGCRIDSVIGKGSQATVYKGHHLTLDIPVAMKILHSQVKKAQTQMAERFLKEARVIARLKHPNIVGVMNAGEEHGYSYIVMQHVVGRSLDDALRKRAQISANDFIRLALDICGALRAAHENGIVHGDVKPANILLTSVGTTMLVDFGLVKDLKTYKTEASTGMALGTPLYMSPEQARGQHLVDIRTDIYSLGATLYHVLSGKPPFSGATALEIIRKHIKEDPVPLKDFLVNVPQRLSDIVGKAMRKKPEERFQSAEALKQELLNLSRDMAITQFKPISKEQKRVKAKLTLFS